MLCTTPHSSRLPFSTFAQFLQQEQQEHKHRLHCSLVRVSNVKAMAGVPLAIPPSRGNERDCAQHDSNPSSAVHVVTPPTATATAATSRQRVIKRCTVVGCGKIARSRGSCKSHGGGKRCNEPGCALSDQGGGFCIRHGGGKRCEVPGCLKSAQARRVCKAHGGGVRCRVDGCTKTSQGGGCCRAHGGGPRASKKSKSAGDSSGITAAAPRVVKTEKTELTSALHDVKVESPHSPSTELEAMGPARLLERSTSASPADSTSSASHDAQRCCIDGCANAVPATSRQQLCDDHGTSVLFAASLLEMLATEQT